MSHYNPTTGHTTNPAASTFEDVPMPKSYYLVMIDGGPVEYGVFAVDAWTAERATRRMYHEDTGLKAEVVRARYAPKQYKEL